jgi:hypothetical protein
MGSKSDNPKYTPDELRLRSLGFMTKDEFVEKITSGLSAYLDNTWPKEGLQHPEDLMANTYAFIEASSEVIRFFGAGSTVVE